MWYVTIVSVTKNLSKIFPSSCQEYFFVCEHVCLVCFVLIKMANIIKILQVLKIKMSILAKL